MLVEVPVGLLLAAMLTSGVLRRSEGIYRTLLFIPATLSVVIVGFIWRLIINPLWGIVGFPLLGNSLTALPTISLMARLAVFRHPDGVPLFGPDRRPRRSGRGGAHRRRDAWRIFWRIKFPLDRAAVRADRDPHLHLDLQRLRPGVRAQRLGARPELLTDILGTLFYRTFFGSSGQVADLDLGATVATVIFP